MIGYSRAHFEDRRCRVDSIGSWQEGEERALPVLEGTGEARLLVMEGL